MTRDDILDALRPYDAKLADDAWLADMVKITGAETLANRAMHKLIEARRLLREVEENYELSPLMSDRIRAFLDGETKT